MDGIIGYQSKAIPQASWQGVKVLSIVETCKYMVLHARRKPLVGCRSERRTCPL